jgi:uncharacterized protein YecT (DUF1311 family)
MRILLTRRSLPTASHTSMRILVYALLLSGGTPIFAASFDCTKTLTKVEGLICATEPLSALDSRLARAYTLTRDNEPESQKPTLVAEQRNWIRTTRDRCPDAGCLMKEYGDRLRVLESIKTAKVTAEYVTDDNIFAGRMSHFQNQLRRLGLTGTLSCSLMIHLIVDQPAGHDQSYGALCKLNNTDLKVCDDTMVGKFTQTLGSPTDHGDSVAEFTAINCPPGG